MRKSTAAESGSFSELLQYFRAAFGRYLAISWAPALAVSALGMVFCLLLSDYYVADSLLSIQQQKISSKIVDAPNKTEQSERLQALIFEILSRPRLQAVIDEFKLYPEQVGVIGKEIALQQLRNSIVVEPVLSKTGDRLVQTFRLEFSHHDPKVAYEVTRSIANLFIEESMLSTRSETEGTEEFLDAQLRAARQKLEFTEQQVQAFVRENFEKLPEHLNASVARLENAQSQLATNSQLISANLSRLAYLQQDFQITSHETAAVPSEGNAGLVDPRDGLAQLESALVILSSKYSDKHPDVISTKRKIAALRERLASGEQIKGDPSDNKALPLRRSPEVRTVRREIAEIESQLTALKEENKHLRDTIDELERNIKEMPLKEQELIKIRRDYDNVKASYERLATAREEAGLQTSLVSSQKGTQFRIIEPPALPVVPAGPNRLALVAGSIVVGLAMLVLIPLGLFAINGGFKFRNELEKDTGLRVLGVVPPMQTLRAIALHRRALSTSVVASVCSFLLGWAVMLFVS